MRLKRAGRYEIYAFWRRRPIVKDTVLYESFAGNGMLCNPEAIFRELLSAPDMADLRHVWVLTDLDEYATTVNEFANDSRVSFVRHGSPHYFRVLATSEYLINNATFPQNFSKRAGQIYINTWHGTPMKKMGYDVPGGARSSSNVLRNFVHADYLLSASPFMTNQMYHGAYRLSGVFRGVIIEEGYPRIDRQALTPELAEQSRSRIAGMVPLLRDRRIILYAPTWRGSSFGMPEDDIDELLRRVTAMNESVDSDRYVVLLKAHQTVHDLARTRPELQRYLVPNELPSNVVLGVSDILITDYSSIAFDFLATGRPLLYFVPDIDDYDESRGLYLDPGEWPGPISHTLAELAGTLASVAGKDSAPFRLDERYRSAQSRFVPYDDGAVTKRVVDIIFRGRVEGARTFHGTGDGRIAMLIYLGGMRSNGITTSALSLLRNIDYERFDVSVFYASSSSRDAVRNQQAIDPRARQFPRVGGMNGPKVHHLVRHLDYRRGRMHRYRDSAIQGTLWADEWDRCFGPASQFDAVIDFSGYGPFWTLLLLQAPGAVRSIWLHNELAADMNRTIDGKKPLHRSLSQVFSLYAEYDRLVSVSPTLSRINERALAGYARPGAFTWALNTIDMERIERNVAQGIREVWVDPSTGAIPDWVRDLTDDSLTTFVTVGRLSPEKNQARLIRAFAALHAAHPATRLLIVGGGVLQAELAELIDSLGLAGLAHLTGPQENPHAILAEADCFVLSSDYEGQPMVILEAFAVGLPVVTVEFASVGDSVGAGNGLIVPRTVEGLTAGMEAFLRGEVPCGGFDAQAYNTIAIEQFYEAVGVLDVQPALGAAG